MFGSTATVIVAEERGVLFMADREIRYLLVAVEGDSVWTIEPDDMDIFKSEQNDALEGAWKPWESQVTGEAALEKVAEFISDV